MAARLASFIAVEANCQMAHLSLPPPLEEEEAESMAGALRDVAAVIGAATAVGRAGTHLSSLVRSCSFDNRTNVWTFLPHPYRALAI